MRYPIGYPIVSYSILIYPIFASYILEKYPAFYPVMISFYIYPNGISQTFIPIGYPIEYPILSCLSLLILDLHHNISYKDILHVILL